MKIKETCACGATFEIKGPVGYEITQALEKWRAEHHTHLVDTDDGKKEAT